MIKTFRRAVEEVSAEYECQTPAVRVMPKKQGRREGFAYYVPATNTIHINAAASRLRRADLYVLAIHEVAHAWHTERMRGPVAGSRQERCAMACEGRYAKAFGVEREAREWLSYRRARVALDKAVRRDPSMGESEARRLMLRHCPARMVRVRSELRRVRERPGEVHGYLHGEVRRSDRCPCPL